MEKHIVELEKKIMHINYEMNSGEKGSLQSPIYILQEYQMFVAKTVEQGIDVSMTGLVEPDRIHFLKIANSPEYHATYWKTTRANKEYEGTFGFIPLTINPMEIYKQIAASYESLDSGKNEVNILTTNITDALRNDRLPLPNHGEGKIFMK
ncbi:MAG: hypothetical protein ACQESE_03510 [Nanobdellota archaeon]